MCKTGYIVAVYLELDESLKTFREICVFFAKGNSPANLSSPSTHDIPNYLAGVGEMVLRPPSLPGSETWGWNAIITLGMSCGGPQCINKLMIK